MRVYQGSAREDRVVGGYNDREVRCSQPTAADWGSRRLGLAIAVQGRSAEATRLVLRY